MYPGSRVTDCNGRYILSPNCIVLRVWDLPSTVAAQAQAHPSLPLLSPRNINYMFHLPTRALLPSSSILCHPFQRLFLSNHSLPHFLIVSVQ